MSGRFVLDWAIMAVSLFNTILLLWLGLTVLLNAERRTWGIWLAAGGLLMGAAFFFSHSAILGYGLHEIGFGTNFWWRVGWLPVLALPFAWYLVILWYAGYWDDRFGYLRQRHRPWFVFMSLQVITLVTLYAWANPIPSFWQVAQLDLTAAPALAGVPVLLLVFPLHIILCIGLSLDVLGRPAPSERMMGELARHRARPWLTAASVVLLVVSLLVAGLFVWLVFSARQQPLYELYAGMLLAVSVVDLIIASLIAVSVLLLGKATVSYEVFAGRTLPRRGLVRQWQWAIVLAAGYGLAVGWSLTLNLRAVYGLLLTAMLMTFFYALLSRYSYAERERTIEHLRPFVASQRLYEHLLMGAEAPSPDFEVHALFAALCGDLLGARAAYLAPLGPLTPLVGSALAFPDGDWSAPPPLDAVTGRLHSADTLCVEVDPKTHAGAAWAVPLWSQDRLIGVLLLGEKQDRGLYSQEEMAIAQAGGERLMDTLASAEIARRLMGLQRQRLSDCRDYDELSQVVNEQRTRRLLHDEVLPLLHAAMLTMGAGPSHGAETREAQEMLGEAHHQISDLLREMPSGNTPAVDQLGLVGALRAAVEEEMAGDFDEIAWRVEPEAERAAEGLPLLVSEVIYYATREAIRNAARHGRKRERSECLCLEIGIAWRSGLKVSIGDNGVGIEPAGVDNGGQGLAMHSTMMAVVGGVLSVESQPGVSTRVVLFVPQEKVSEGESKFA